VTLSTFLSELLYGHVLDWNGLSEHDAQLLEEGFGITTIENLANNKFFHRAQAINILAR